MFIYFIYYDQGSWEQKIKHRIKRLQRSFARRSIAYQKVDDPGSTPASSKKSLRKTEEMWSSVPEIPEEETDKTLGEKVKQLKKICRSSRPDQSAVQNLMTETYPLSRKSVLEQQLGLKSLLAKYPPLQKSPHASAFILSIYHGIF